MHTIAIIDVGAGNLYSVEKAVRHVASANDKIIVATKAEQLQAATHIILPGVGAFANCMKGLLQTTGMREALEQKVLIEKIPFFGICVGMQMLFEQGHEHEVTQGLGWLKGSVMPLAPADKSLKIPHMGWNELNIQQPHTYFNGLEEANHAYFVHSYHCVPDEDITVLTANYGGDIVAAVARDNIFATQFHPEKSQKTGLRILQNFLQLPHAA